MQWKLSVLGTSLGLLAAGSWVPAATAVKDWPSYNNTLTSERFAPLDTIDSKNVTGLKLRCSFDTGEQSKNCGWLNWFTLGEGWHNNHHRKDIAAAQAILPEEERSDISYQILLLLEKMDMIKIVYKYTDSEIAEARRLDALAREKRGARKRELATADV